jgi:membrane protein YqaA with SNARE-associated domain
LVWLLMEAWFTPEAGLAGLFLSAFLAATLLPGGSELALLAYLGWQPGALWSAIAVASVGNTLGGITSVAIGRFLPQMPPDRWSERARSWVERYGAVILVLSWLPLIGDALCVLAGWLRLKWAPVTGWMALGKTLRYLVLGLAVA